MKNKKNKLRNLTESDIINRFKKIIIKRTNSRGYRFSG